MGQLYNLRLMIRMIQSSSAGHAKAYFTGALSRSDYYMDDQEMNGRFQGKLADRLNVSGSVTKDVFHSLCDNINPINGQNLTPRYKDERTVGYDINFHCPKSASILHGLSKDNHILEAFQSSVNDTMRDMEEDAKTRVRKKGQLTERETGELIWADFIHQTARPIDGSLPDPHLHAHCFVFNATYDPVEKQIKAGQFRDIKRDMPYYQARFHKRLSDRLIELGYEVRRTKKSFEVAGVPQKVIDLFSKRTDEIGRIAKEKNITNAKALDELGAKTRARKQKGLTMAELKTEWRRQIRELESDKETEGSQVVRFARHLAKESITAEQCVDHALDHSFERASVMADRRILEAAYRFGLGDKDVSVEEITKAFRKDRRIIHVEEKNRKVCTTREVLREEKAMVELAREGRGKMRPLYKELPKIKSDGQQKAAIEHVLTTQNQVSIIRGTAGAGKTTLMKEAVELIEKAGKKVTILAPTSQASRGVLREEGFENAETVAKFILDKKQREGLKNQVLLVDEAGLLGTSDMRTLLQIANSENARLILVGDTRQHASVVRGDALRILNTVAGIKTAEVSKIYRQKNVEYRAAVEDLSKGDVRSGFEKLDKAGFIKTIDPMNPNKQLVDDYVEAVKKGKSALIISPTHKQGDEVTDEVRARLKSKGLIGKKEISVKKLISLGLTEAQKNDWRNFQKGQVLKFTQNAPGIKRGSMFTIDKAKENELLLKDEKGNETLLMQNAKCKFEVFEQTEIKVAKGDKIRTTSNGFDTDKKRLDNGALLEVTGVSKKGEIKLRNSISKSTYRLNKDFGHLTHAHCITSHASQGKTVDEVFITQPSSTFDATNAKQFYVSVSRARNVARVYTDDKETLLERASELGDRQSAIELVYKDKLQERQLEQIMRIQVNQPEKPIEKQKTPEPIKQDRDLDYEY